MNYRRIWTGLLWLNLLLLLLFVAATVWADSSPSPAEANLARPGLAIPVTGAPLTDARTNLSASAVTTSYVYLPFVIKNHSVPTLTPLWRFGAAKVRQSPLAYQSAGISALRLGWYVDYQANGSALPTLGMDYVPVVRVKQLKLKDGSPTSIPCYACPYVTPYTYTISPALSQLPSLAQSRPGLLWVIGNEVERRDWWVTGGADQGQDEIVPELYAQAYHEAYTAIKNADPTAKGAIGSMVEWTPLRQQYMDRVLSAYATNYGQAIPVDVWNLHIFILQEVAGDWGAGIPAGLSNTVGTIYTPLQNKDFSIAWNQIIAFRTWLKNQGQQNKPLVITEYGVLLSEWYSSDFSPTRVWNDFLYPSFNYFSTYTDASIGYPADGNRLVQRWIWYSVDDDSLGPYGQNFNGNLFYSGLQSQPIGLTTLGTYWRNHVSTLPNDSGSHY